jgi:glyoxalase family protein
MAIEGLHHITAITGDAPVNVDFYARLLGLRMVKKTVNFDQPDVYHLYYGDETGVPGSIMTFFEFPGAAPGRPGAGMVHTVQWRVRDADAIGFWEDRLAANGIDCARIGDTLRFADPEGLDLELLVDEASDEPLVAQAPDVPAEAALLGFHGVRAYHADPGRSDALLGALGFSASGDGSWDARGSSRGGVLRYDAPPAAPGIQSAGSVHHIAWSVADDDELTSVRAQAVGQGAHATPIIDRQYFHSVYFREPSGVLFELASRDIGFDVDEPRESLGESLKLPPQYEDRRAELEQALTPIVNPRQAVA